MQTLYIISGLGVDERIFQRINFSPYPVKHIVWEIPYKNEKIEDYALRLTKQINEENPILIGLSFGGIIAIEISKQIPVEKIILLASVKTRKEIPFYFKAIGFLKLHYIVPNFLFKKANFITYWMFGTKNQEEKKLLSQILKDIHPKFLKWAINAIVNWENKMIPKELSHIHGEKDRLLSAKYVQNKILIKNTGHFLTYNKPEEIMSEILKIIN